jgi:hypothetical protein
MGAVFKFILSKNERKSLNSLTKKGEGKHKTAILARALLLCESLPEGKGWQNKEVSNALGISEKNSRKVKRRFVEGGLENALERKPMDTSRREIKFDAVFEAQVIALACSEPPDGIVRWTTRLLADKLV